MWKLNGESRATLGTLSEHLIHFRYSLMNLYGSTYLQAFFFRHFFLLLFTFKFFLLANATYFFGNVIQLSSQYIENTGECAVNNLLSVGFEFEL